MSKRLNGYRHDKKEVTAVHQHESNTSHAFDLANTKDSGIESSDYARNMLEIIYIIKNRDEASNFRADVEKLGVVNISFSNHTRPTNVCVTLIIS